MSLLTACSPTPDSRVRDALALQSKGQLGEATRLLRTILEEDADNAEANFVLGRMLVQNDRPGPALAPLAKAAASKEFEKRAGLLLASTQLQARAYQGAVETTTRLLENDSTNRIALLIRGKSQLAAGEPEPALEDAQRILALDPDDYNAISLKGGALVDLERPEDAEQVWIDLKNRLGASGNESQGARACTQLSLFYRTQQQHDQVDETVRACLEDYPADVFLQKFATDFLLERGETERVLTIHKEAVEAAPENLALWMRLADVHRTAGRTSEARAALERGLAGVEAPTESFRYALAELFLEEGDFESARDIRAGLQSETYQQLFDGVIALREGDAASALKKLSAGLQKAPNHPNAHFAAGEAALALNEPARATRAFREAMRIGEHTTLAALRLAQIEFASRNYVRAHRLAAYHLERRPFEDATAHRIAIQSALRVGDVDAAKAHVEELKTRAPESADWRVEFSAIARQEKGPAAAAAFLQSQAIDFAAPANEDALRTLVADLNASEQASRSLSLITNAIAAAEGNPALYELKARTLLALGRPKAASTELTRALALDPAFPAALEAKALVALRANQPKQALESFRAAANAAPRNPDYPYAAASLARQLGDENGAVTHLEETLRRQPNYSAAANDLAWILASRGEDLDRALRLTRIAIQQDQSVNNLDTLGWVRFQRGEFEKAISVFEVALENDEARSAIRYRLGLSLSRLGRTDEARSQLERVIAGPASPEIENARAALAKLGSS